MPLTSGTLLGPYQVVAPIGAGGMGEVYRARDKRLDRDVALKILPAEMAGDTGRAQRFEQEARAVAALNHPNIVAVYDVGREAGVFYIVSELVDGESLRGAKFWLRKTIDVAAQIAAGLAATHAAGITHRDLKPDNILLTRHGRVKILDFGLAKVAATRDAKTDAGETLTVGTGPGVVMGTVGYMSPEQVRGEAADHRSDIFNLGLILYELLSGQRAFQAETLVETMTAVLKQDTPELPESVPANLRRIVEHCLEKDPADRFQSAKDLGFALAQSATQTGAAPVIALRRTWLRWVAIAVASAALGAAAGVFLWRAPAPLSWTSMKLGGPEVAWMPRLSPDGHTLAMLTLVGEQSQVAIMRPEAGDWAVLTHDGDRGSSMTLSWSPDGSRIFYDRQTDVPKGIYSVPVLGGEPRLVMENATLPEALPDGSLLAARFNPRSELQLCRYWPESGNLREFPFLVNFFNTQPLRAFPGGREAVVVGSPLPAPAGQIVWRPYVLDLASGRTRELPAPDYSRDPMVTVTRDGRSVLYSGRPGGMCSVAADGRSAERMLFPVPGELFGGLEAGPDHGIYLSQVDRLSELVHIAGGHARRMAVSDVPMFWAQVAILPTGRAVWAQVTAGRTRLVAVEPGKEASPLISTSEPTTMPAALGPDRLALLVGPPGKQKIGIASLATGRIDRRIAFDKGDIQTMISSPDGKTLYCTAGHAVWAVPVAGGAPVRIRDGDGVSIDPDGRYLAVITLETLSARLYKVPLDGSAEKEITLSGAYRPTTYTGARAISRDGRMLVGLTSADSWFWRPGIVDLTTGRTTLIPTDFRGDYSFLNWTADGQVMAVASPMRAAIWKFTPAAR